jgi:mersacidin/lichenicidin family type 2 lantibiotic
MSQENIIRAWKDESFRHGLGETERSLLPEHPAGLVVLNDQELKDVGGMTGPKCSLYCGEYTVTQKRCL